jgi:hypothetical protein
MHEGVKSIRFVVLAAAAGLVLTGCGDESTPGSESSPTNTPTASTSTPGALPLTVTRTGGFAGYNDQVVIGTDGIASVNSKGKAVRCKLDSGFLGTIVDAAKQVDWADVGVTKPTVRHPDDMIIAVSAGGGTARLEDPKLKPMVTSVSKLLTEAAVPPGKLCKPV